MDKSCPFRVRPASNESGTEGAMKKALSRSESARHHDWQRGEYCTGMARWQEDFHRQPWQAIVSHRQPWRIIVSMKSCKRLFVALRSCPASQHFTHGKKYFEKMLARFHARH